MAEPPTIVVVGGGAGGLELVARLGRKIARRKHPRAQIVLIERNRSHIWKPLLHEVASGALDSALDELGYRGHAHRFRYKYIFGEFESLDRENREVVIAPFVDEEGAEITGRHRVRYDYLVLAIGSVSNDFGTPGVLEHCIFLDKRKQAERFRRKLLDCCLRVSRQARGEADGRSTVRVSIVGAGATGVELAAELHNSAEALTFYGLDNFDPDSIRITLLEAGPKILPMLPERISDAAREELEHIGVRVVCDAKVASVDADGLTLASGERISADMKVWAAGVKGPDVLRNVGGLQTNARNQIVVRPTLQSVDDDRVFAIGDCAACPLPDGSGVAPPRAQTAHQMAERLAKNFELLLAGKPLRAYRYTDHGSLVSLSGYSTIGSLMGNLFGGSMKVEGRIARLVYISLYRMHLMAVQGWLRASFMILAGHMNRVIRPRMKLH